MLVKHQNPLKPSTGSYGVHQNRPVQQRTLPDSRWLPVLFVGSSVIARRVWLRHFFADSDICYNQIAAQQKMIAGMAEIAPVSACVCDSFLSHQAGIPW